MEINTKRITKSSGSIETEIYWSGQSETLKVT